MPPSPQKHRCAVLDDYQDAAFKVADWSVLDDEVDFTVFNRPLGGSDDIVGTLKGYSMVVLTLSDA